MTTEQRSAIQFCVVNRISSKGTVQMLEKAYGILGATGPIFRQTRIRASLLSCRLQGSVQPEVNKISSVFSLLLKGSLSFKCVEC